jgi:hypothetical protein
LSVLASLLLLGFVAAVTDFRAASDERQPHKGIDRKGEAAMRSSIRQMTMIFLLTVLLAPGLLHARTAPLRHQDTARFASIPELGIAGKFASVWSLLTNYAKTGGQMDPNGGGTPPPPSGGSGMTTTTLDGDTGGQMDPNGGTPK